MPDMPDMPLPVSETTEKPVVIETETESVTSVGGSSVDGQENVNIPGELSGGLDTG